MNFLNITRNEQTQKCQSYPDDDHQTVISGTGNYDLYKE